MNRQKVLLVLYSALALLVIGACRLGSFTEQNNNEGTGSNTGQEPEDSLSVATLDDVKFATVRIETTATFTYPEGEFQNVVPSGSGFILDQSGLAVTNHHVVTGAGLIEVYLHGESEPRNAKLLGSSECSDLAVIDIDGQGFQHLEWYQGELAAGLDVYAAGFPLGDPEFTLNRGIISKERAHGDSFWASVDYVLEHDAVINPGNSGGPLVTGDGKVVGINYASYDEARQSFAIARDEALGIIDQLRQGQDVDSLGINGWARLFEDGSSGIWVFSVESGSPAASTGIQAGDFITELENLIMAADGTMADYCDVLRSHRPGDALAVELLRFDAQTGEVSALRGEINGRPLVVEETFGISQDVDPGVPYAGYQTVTDDSGAILMEIPAEWNDVDGSPWLDDDGQVLGASITASTNIEDWTQSYAVPGVFFTASQSLLAAGYTEDLLLDGFDYSADCTYDGRYPYEDSLYTGLFDAYVGCGPQEADLINLTVVPSDRSFVIILQIQVVTQADLDALEKIIASFQVVGDLP